MIAGEAALAISLADSLFLSISPDAARSRVLLFLAISLAPFAVLAPLIGPVIDRLPGGRRLTVVGVGVIRAVLLVAMMRWINSLALFPIAFASLVAAKVYAVSRSAIVPTVVASDEALMAANGRLGRLSGIVGFVVGAPAALLQLVDTRLSLGLSAVCFSLAAIAALALPRHVAAATKPADSTEVEELHRPVIRWAAFAMLVLRSSVGFMFFHMAFWLRDQKAGTAWFGLAVVVSSIAVFAANSIGPLLRKRFAERVLLDGSLIVVAVAGLVTGYAGGITAGIGLIAVVNGTAAVGRLAFEAIVQAQAPDANRARAFVRFETNNQIAWVVAGLVAVVFTFDGAIGFLLVGVASGLAAAYYLYRSS
jgi:MFS family permease